MGKGKYEKLRAKAERLAEANFKKFKKKNGDVFESKKKMKKAYYETLCDYLPDSVDFIVKYGYNKENQEIKEGIYQKLLDEDFGKAIEKGSEDDKNFLEDLSLLPIVIRDMNIIAKKQAAEDSEAEGRIVEYPMDDLIEISQKILKKKIKKLTKAGVDEDVAFDILSIIPSDDCLENGFNYRIRLFMNTLYEHAKNKAIDFGKVVTYIFPENYAKQIVLFCLLERKSKFNNFNENKQKLFIQINEWVFSVMEEMDKEDIENIIKVYVDTRKRDASNNRDENRRYFLKSLPDTEFPRVRKVIDHMLEMDGDLEKFF